MRPENLEGFAGGRPCVRCWRESIRVGGTICPICPESRAAMKAAEVISGQFLGIESGDTAGFKRRFIVLDPLGRWRVANPPNGHDVESRADV